MQLEALISNLIWRDHREQLYATFAPVSFEKLIHRLAS